MQAEPDKNVLRRIWLEHKGIGIGGFILLVIGGLIQNNFYNWLNVLLLPVWGWLKTIFNQLHIPLVNLIGWFILLLGLVVIIGLVIKVQSDINKEIKKHILELVVNKRFENQVIILDGKNFIDCAFENCTIEWKGEPYAFSNLKWKNLSFRFRENNQLVNAVGFMRAFKLLDVQFLKALQAVEEKDLDKGFSYHETQQEPKVSKNNKQRKRTK